MLNEALELIKKRPPDGFRIFYEKYRSLLEDERLIQELLSWEWNEETYKSLCFFAHDIIYKACVICPDFVPEKSIYLKFESFILILMYTYFNYLPFSVISPYTEEAFHLLKKLFLKKELKGDLQDNENFKSLDEKQYERLKQFLKTEKVLSCLLSSEKEDVESYKDFMALARFVHEPGGLKPLPVYKQIEKYMYEWMSGSWNRFYFQKIHFKEWEPIAIEGASLLKSLLRKGLMEDFKNQPSYKKLCERAEFLYQELLLRDYEEMRRLLESEVPREGFKEFIEVFHSQPVAGVCERFEKLVEIKNPRLFEDLRYLAVLLKEPWSEAKYFAIHWFKHSYFYYDVDVYNIGKRPLYKWVGKYVRRKTFIYTTAPFKEFEDCEKEKIDLLSLFIKDRILHAPYDNKDDPLYGKHPFNLEFSKKFYLRWNKLKKKGLSHEWRGVIYVVGSEKGQFDLAGF